MDTIPASDPNLWDHLDCKHLGIEETLYHVHQTPHRSCIQEQSHQPGGETSQRRQLSCNSVHQQLYLLFLDWPMRIICEHNFLLIWMWNTYLRMNTEVFSGAQGQTKNVLFNSKLFFIVINQFPQLFHNFLKLRNSSWAIYQFCEFEGMCFHVGHN